MYYIIPMETHGNGNVIHRNKTILFGKKEKIFEEILFSQFEKVSNGKLFFANHTAGCRCEI